MTTPTPVRADRLLDLLVQRCMFGVVDEPIAIAYSGGPDSTALLALARHAGFDVVAHHVDHMIRDESGTEAEHAGLIAHRLGARFELHRVEVTPGPNLEARARTARLAVLPDGAMTGHTLEDQAETVLIRLLRGSGGDGLAAIEPGRRHPILGLRRADTEAVCEALGIEPVRDRSNESPHMWRNRVRNELLPLAADIADRDVVPLLARTAELLRADNEVLDRLASTIDPTDAAAVTAAEPVLSARALRSWLAVDGYPPDAAALARVMAVAGGDAIACELSGGRRVRRSGQRLFVEPT